jgi:WD40 repeat protein
MWFRLVKPGGQVLGLAFSYDSKALAAGRLDNAGLETLEVHSSELDFKMLPGYEDAVYSVAFSPRSRTLASGTRDGTIIVWNLETQVPLGALLGTSVSGSDVGAESETATSWSIAFSPDGSTLISGNSNGEVAFWDVASRKWLGEPVKAHDNPVAGLAVSPDGKVLASVGSGDLVLWNLASRQRIGAPWPIGGTALSVAFSPNGETLASIDLDGQIQSWDVKSRSRLAGLTLRTGIDPTAMGMSDVIPGTTISASSLEGGLNRDFPDAGC